MSLPPVSLLRRITTRVLQRVREDRNETGIIRRLTGEIISTLRAGKEDSLLRPPAAVRLNPFPAHAVQRTSPQARFWRPRRSWVLPSQCCTHLCRQKIVAGELQVVYSALRVEKKDRFASPQRSGNHWRQ